MSAAGAYGCSVPDAGAVVGFQIEPGPAPTSEPDIGAWRQPRLRPSLQVQMRRRELYRQRFSFSGHLHLSFFFGKPKRRKKVTHIIEILLPMGPKSYLGGRFF